MPRVQSQPSTAECTLPSFADLAPLLDELARVAVRELHHPVKIDVTGWDDGDYTVRAFHHYGYYPGTDIKGKEVLDYDRDREVFIARYVERDTGTGEMTVLVERNVGRFPDPISSRGWWSRLARKDGRRSTQCPIPTRIGAASGSRSFETRRPGTIPMSAVQARNNRWRS